MALAVRQLVEREIAPAAVEDDGSDRFPAASLDKLGELGLFGATIPPEMGGLGLDATAYVLIAEEIGRGSATVAAVLEPPPGRGGHTAARLCRSAEAAPARSGLGQAARRHADAAGQIGGARAQRGEAGGWLRDHRPWSHRLPGRADLFVVMAPVDGRLRCFVLHAGQPGFALIGPFPTLGHRGADLRHAELTGCLVPPAQALGGDLIPEPAAMTALESASRVREAGGAVGLAQAAFESALRYSQQRSAFGVPICQHQAIQL